MSAFTKTFVEVPDNARFTEYAGGFAKQLLCRLHNHEGITPGELAWLRMNTGLTDSEAACKQLIDAYTLQQVTQRITT